MYSTMCGRGCSSCLERHTCTSLSGAGFCSARRTGEGKREDSPTRGREQRQLSWYVCMYDLYVCMYVCMTCMYVCMYV